MKIGKIILTALILVFLAGCGGGGSSGPSAQELARDKIAAYATGTSSTIPSVTDYQNAGMTMVNAGNKSEVDAFVRNTNSSNYDDWVFDTDGDGVIDAIDAYPNDNTRSTYPPVSLSGKLTFDLISANSNHIGLDYANITSVPARGILVAALDSDDTLIQSTTTDSSGNYTFTELAANSAIKIRVYASLYKTGTPSWDVDVVDNTNNDARYVVDTPLESVGTTNSTRDFNIPSGWNSSTSSYDSNRLSGIFAILDTTYQSIQKVLTANANLQFPPLDIHWSPNNKASSGELADGDIGTSYYFNSNLYILGDATTNGDTDEFDDHVIAHEWGHYYEDKFSRSDSIGGNHSNGDLLDIRVAFGEGWGNAISAITLDDQNYFDTSIDGSGDTTGWTMDIENETHDNPGWFSESSIQRIIYDLYDNTDDAGNDDTLSLGFGPIHHVMVGQEKDTEAFTSIFSFIYALKDESSVDNASKIDDIVASENIGTIDDAFGTGRTHNTDDYPYHDLTPNGSITTATTKNNNGSYNKLNNTQYIKFHVSTSGNYNIKVEQTNGTNADPDFDLYKMKPSKVYQGRADDEWNSIENRTISLDAGSDYIIDLYDYNNITSATFDITVQQ